MSPTILLSAVLSPSNLRANTLRTGILTAGILGSGILGCGADDDALAADLTDAVADYASWGQASGLEGIFTSADGTHGPHVQIWGDTAALDALSSGGAFPDGAVWIKEGYSDDTGATVSGLTAMMKVDGYDEAGGDWYWASLDPDTLEVKSGGAMDSCYGCHQSMDTDGDGVVFDDVL